jgi:hypothetical protein
MAPSRDTSEGVAIVSKYTAPVNHSLGPGVVSRSLRVICMGAGFETIFEHDDVAWALSLAVAR